jgi:small-conductance mechanosensitive channel
MIDFLTLIWTDIFYRRLILTGLILIGQLVVHRIILSIVLRRIKEDSPYIYAVRKTIAYSVNVLTVLLLFNVWVVRLGDLSVALGILAAGLAFALQEIIGSFAGWVTIITGRPLSIGDRVETGGIRGDVIDVSILRTTLMEIGNWLQGDHNTGRIVTVSNAFIFKEPLFNYSAHLRFIWDEITIPITYDSDLQKAIQIMLDSVRENSHYLKLLPRADEQRKLARKKLAVKITSLEPRVFVKITDNWIELGMVYPVDNDLRRTFRSEVSQQILSEFSNADITIASQTVAIVQFPTGDAATRINQP